ncbi:lipoprotein-anchoring transpeptidase ErfK/SrfK [Elusimicrobium posterum]|uniref:L,D-transpeptidase n=1 Tax=Elusimicrobium posterum TaxID=3116653 RepID=UPI003C7696BA
MKRKLFLAILSALLLISGTQLNAQNLTDSISKKDTQAKAAQKLKTKTFNDAYDRAFWILSASVLPRDGYSKEQADKLDIAYRIEVSDEQLGIMAKNNVNATQLEAIKTLNKHAKELQKKDSKNCAVYKPAELEDADKKLLKDYQAIAKYRKASEIIEKKEIDSVVKTTKKILELKFCSSKATAEKTEAVVKTEDKTTIENAPTTGYWIIVNTTKNILMLYKGKDLEKTYPVASGQLTVWGKPKKGAKSYEGQTTPTPNRKWTVTGKKEHRIFREGYDDESKTAYGPRWIGLDTSGTYAIHGTNDPGSIGSHASHGCIRMYNKDIKVLYEYVKVGTIVITGTEEYLSKQPWKK